MNRKLASPAPFSLVTDWSPAWRLSTDGLVPRVLLSLSAPPATDFSGSLSGRHILTPGPGMVRKDAVAESYLPLVSSLRKAGLGRDQGFSDSSLWNPRGSVEKLQGHAWLMLGLHVRLRFLRTISRPPLF